MPRFITWNLRNQESCLTGALIYLATHRDVHGFALQEMGSRLPTDFNHGDGADQIRFIRGERTTQTIADSYVVATQNYTVRHRYPPPETFHLHFVTPGDRRTLRLAFLTRAQQNDEITLIFSPTDLPDLWEPVGQLPTRPRRTLNYRPGLVLQTLNRELTLVNLHAGAPRTRMLADHALRYIDTAPRQLRTQNNRVAALTFIGDMNIDLEEDDILERARLQGIVRPPDPTYPADQHTDPYRTLDFAINTPGNRERNNNEILRQLGHATNINQHDFPFALPLPSDHNPVAFEIVEVEAPPGDYPMMEAGEYQVRQGPDELCLIGPRQARYGRRHRKRDVYEDRFWLQSETDRSHASGATPRDRRATFAVWTVASAGNRARCLAALDRGLVVEQEVDHSRSEQWRIIPVPVIREVDDVETYVIRWLFRDHKGRFLSKEGDAGIAICKRLLCEPTSTDSEQDGPDFPKNRYLHKIEVDTEAPQLRYARPYTLGNGGQGRTGRRWLNACGEANRGHDAGALYGVLCGTEINLPPKRQNAGLWRIWPVSSARREGDPVRSGDSVIIQNGYQDWHGGYLTLSIVISADHGIAYSNAITMKEGDGFSVWTVKTDSGSDVIKVRDPVRLTNQGYPNLLGVLGDRKVKCGETQQRTAGSDSQGFNKEPTGQWTFDDL